MKFTTRQRAKQGLDQPKEKPSETLRKVLELLNRKTTNDGE
jgi:hypothetical protein